MNAAPSLHELQLWLKWIITDPRGVTDAVTDPRPKVERYKNRYTEPTKSCLEWLEKSSLNSTARLDVYAEGYFSRILECMAKDFSRTKKIVGEAAFTKLVSEYLKAYPSKVTSIDETGSQFSGFIAEFNEIPLAEWVADLALFEWSWIEAFYAEDFVSDACDWRKEIAGNNQIRFKVHPSVRLLNSRWPLAKLLRVLDADDIIDPKDFNRNEASGLIIYRSANEVSWDELDLSLLQILQNLKNQIPIAEAFSKEQNIDPNVISQNFTSWVERGILCGVLNEGNGVNV